MISHQIGEGSYSTVVAESFSTSLRAIKKIPIDHPYSTRFALNQSSILQACNHPNIVRLHRNYTNQSERVHCLQMQYLSGGNLQGINLQNNFHLLTIWLRQIANALTHLHERGIVHRDIKLANIMLDQQGHIRIIDFGMSAWQWQIKRENNPTVGSPCYMAPQIFLKRPYDSKVDVYALGVCVYQLIHHCSPFKGTNKRDYWSNTLQTKPDYSPDCPPEWKTLIEAMLQTKPENRISVNQITSSSSLTQNTSRTTSQLNDLHKSLKQQLKKSRKICPRLTKLRKPVTEQPKNYQLSGAGASFLFNFILSPIPNEEFAFLR